MHIYIYIYSFFLFFSPDSKAMGFLLQITMSCPCALLRQVAGAGCRCWCCELAVHVVETGLVPGAGAGAGCRCMGLAVCAHMFMRINIRARSYGLFVLQIVASSVLQSQ